MQLWNMLNGGMMADLKEKDQEGVLKGCVLCRAELKCTAYSKAVWLNP